MNIEITFGDHDGKPAVFFQCEGATRSVVPNLSLEAVEEIAAALSTAHSFVEQPAPRLSPEPLRLLE